MSTPINYSPSNATPDDFTTNNPYPTQNNSIPDDANTNEANGTAKLIQIQSPPGLSRKVIGGVELGAALGAALGILALVGFCFICSRKKRRKQKYYSRGDFSREIGPSSLPSPSPRFCYTLKGNIFTYEELEFATGGFSNENVIGQGGFGYVYKGILSDGKEVAVKSLKANSGQGEREFQTEIEIISRVHHRHLVSLIGYCNSGGHRMLVYEYVPNKTLEYHLHGSSGHTMNWPSRIKVALGAAKGLSYLHENCNPYIIHRDFKSSNILIDYNFEAKISDFGLAKLTSDSMSHVLTRVVGTFGYMAPEYVSSGKLKKKSDVFSFGIVLIEIMTGRRPSDFIASTEKSLVDWARPLLYRGLKEEGNFGELVDPRLGDNYNSQEMERMAACAISSIRHSAKKRPKMSELVKVLEGDLSLDELIMFRTARMSSKEFGDSGELC